MVDPVRVFAYGGLAVGIASLSIVAASQVAAVAEEPVQAAAAAIDSLFPDSVDPKIFRKYDIVFDESISTEVKRTQVVTKIGHGHMSEVTIVTTPSGTYSTDGLLSPHVEYPGIEKHYRGWDERFRYTSGPFEDGRWTSFSTGSFIYIRYQPPATRT